MTDSTTGSGTHPGTAPATGAPAGSATTPGDLVAGRYELLEMVGTGSMGAVFVAHDLQLDRVVALKQLHSQRPDDEVARARFRTEAQCLAKLDHPSLPRVYDFGEEVAGPAVHPYLVMQFVEGDPLSQLLGERHHLDADRTARLLRGLATALDVVHDHGIVHRDLKPGNVMLRPDATPVLIDFGIASPQGSEPLTATGEILGTLEYISPEQVSGRRATPASDIYSLGVVAFTCLTGDRPFHRETPVASALAHVTDPPPDLPSSVPAALRDLVRRMLAKEPADRPGAAEVAAGLSAVAGVA